MIRNIGLPSATYRYTDDVRLYPRACIIIIIKTLLVKFERTTLETRLDQNDFPPKIPFDLIRVKQLYIRHNYHC